MWPQHVAPAWNSPAGDVPRCPPGHRCARLTRPGGLVVTPNGKGSTFRRTADERPGCQDLGTSHETRAALPGRQNSTDVNSGSKRTPGVVGDLPGGAGERQASSRTAAQCRACLLREAAVAVLSKALREGRASQLPRPRTPQADGNGKRPAAPGRLDTDAPESGNLSVGSARGKSESATHACMSTKIPRRDL